MINNETKELPSPFKVAEIVELILPPLLLVEVFSQSVSNPKVLPAISLQEEEFHLSKNLIAKAPTILFL